MSDFFSKVKHDAFKGDYLTRLLYLNIAVFLAFSLTNAFASLFTGNFGLIPNIADDLLALPSNPLKFALRPWTILTYMFTHFSFRHILFNMIILYFSGKMLMEYLGERRMLSLYIYGGIGGGILYILLYNISPVLTIQRAWRHYRFTFRLFEALSDCVDDFLFNNVPKEFLT